MRNEKKYFLLFMIIYLVSCKEEINNFNNLNYTNKLNLFVLNKCTETPVNNVNISEIDKRPIEYANSNGMITINNLSHGLHKFIIESEGFINKSYEINFNSKSVITDTLYLIEAKYKYDIVSSDKMPVFNPEDSIYYRLTFPLTWNGHDLFKFYGPDYDTCFVNNFLDSSISDVKDMNIKIDSVFYHSYLPQCGPQTISLGPVFVIKLFNKSSKMNDLNYKELDHDYFGNVSICPTDSVEYVEYRIYSGIK